MSHISAVSHLRDHISWKDLQQQLSFQYSRKLDSETSFDYTFIVYAVCVGSPEVDPPSDGTEPSWCSGVRDLLQNDQADVLLDGRSWVHRQKSWLQVGSLVYCELVLSWTGSYDALKIFKDR